MPTIPVEQIYNQVVKPLPPSDRLLLAKMILEGIPPTAIVDYSEVWSEEDLRDATLASLRHATQSFAEEDSDA